jgi:hypothetical protein
MFDALFGQLIDKYGDEFNWYRINETNTSFIHELHSELKPGHPLYEKAIMAVAKCTSRDDVLFLLTDDSYAIVHLTYSTYNTEGFPQIKVLSNIQDTINYIEEQFLLEYQGE